MEKFKISLKAARVNANMTQEQVAKAVHRNKQTIVNWETGITDITFGDIFFCFFYLIILKIPKKLQFQCLFCVLLYVINKITYKYVEICRYLHN